MAKQSYSQHAPLTRILIAAFGLFFLLAVSVAAGGGEFAAKAGKVDLGWWNPDSDGPVSLDGLWIFYWQRLLTPGDPVLEKHLPSDEYIDVPGLWNDYPRNTGKSPGDGFATYRLILSGVPAQTPPLSLYIPEMPTAYRLWANGGLVSENGVVGKNKQEMKPFFLPRIVSLNTSGPDVELLLQISNFYHKDGGIWHSLEIGTERDLAARHKRQVFFDMLLFGGLFIMGLYHLGLFALRQQDRAPLYFGLFCLAAGMRSLLVSQRIFYGLVPGLDWEIQQKMEYLLLYLSGPAFFMFFFHLFPVDVSRRFCSLITWCCGIFCIIVVAAPAKIFGHTGNLFQILIYGAAVYLTFSMVRIIRLKREGALLFAGGFAMLMLTVINDTLYTHLIIQTRPMIHFGVFMFIFFQAFLLSKKFSAAFSKVETISRELALKNRELVQLDQLKDEFLANTSHELKTPLHGIIGLAESMMDGTGEKLSAFQHQNLSIITSSGRRLFNLINDLLDFSKIRRNDMELHLKPVDLKTMADVVIAFSMPLVGGRPLKLFNKIPDNLPIVTADENRLQQVLFNLVGNAVKFTPSGLIEILAEQQKDGVTVTVKDTGIGIAEADQEKIFSEFKQVYGSMDRTYGGTGLGLAISQRLVKLHGSEITVASEPGKGSVFSFRLKIAAGGLPEIRGPQVLPNRFLADAPGFFSDQESDAGTSPGIAPEPSVDQSIKQSGEPSILVVDDEPVNLQLVYNQLSPRGFRVFRANDGFEALEMIADETPDLVLLDIMMPRMNGFEVCRKIRETFSLYALPVVMLTAKNRLSDLVQGLESGANDYLPKPFYKEELLARINILLEAKASVERLKKNQLLKEEIRRRKLVEEKLRVSQRRLVRMLDSSEDAIIAVNLEGSITFFNQGAENLFGFSTNEALHQTLDILFSDFFMKDFMALTGGRSDITAPDILSQEKFRQMLKVTGKTHDGSVFPVILHISAFTIGQDQVFTLIVRPQPEQSHALADANHPAIDDPVDPPDEFDSKSVLTIEHALNQIFDHTEDFQTQELTELRHIDPALDSVSDRLTDDDTGRDMNEMLVRMMNAALRHWEGAGKTKVDLAEESGIWKAYLDKGTWKTRTLDKYIRLETLPKRPRWREVIRTAYFVLSNCDLDADAREELRSLIAQAEEKLKQTKIGD